MSAKGLLSRRFRQGFTMIELLVVIVIIGVLSGLTIGATAHFIESARKKNAADMCRQIAVAWSKFHTDTSFWPDTYGINSPGVKKMDTEMCLVLGSGGFLDVAYIDENATSGQKKNKDNDSQLKYGLLSPIGEKRFKKGSSSNSKMERYLYQFVLDVNEDGVIDASDGMPEKVRGGTTIRGEVAVWCWPEDEDAEKNGEVYAKSW